MSEAAAASANSGMPEKCAFGPQYYKDLLDSVLGIGWIFLESAFRSAFNGDQLFSGPDSPSFGITLRGVGGSQVVPVEFRIRQPNRADYRVRFEVAYHGTK